MYEKNIGNQSDTSCQTYVGLFQASHSWGTTTGRSWRSLFPFQQNKVFPNSYNRLRRLPTPLTKLTWEQNMIERRNKMGPQTEGQKRHQIYHDQEQSSIRRPQTITNNTSIGYVVSQIVSQGVHIIVILKVPILRTKKRRIFWKCLHTKTKSSLSKLTF